MTTCSTQWSSLLNLLLVIIIVLVVVSDMSSKDNVTPKTPGTGRGASISKLMDNGPPKPAGGIAYSMSSGREDIAAQLLALQQQQQLLQEQLLATKQEATDSEAPKEEQTISAVSVKLPDFWPADLALWFARAESMFNMRGVKDQRTKFDHVAFALSNEFATEVRDILMGPRKHHPYDNLKGELIRRLQSSEQKRLRQLLTEEELADRKPSQLLRRMQQLVGTNKLDEALLKELFMGRLPAGVKLVLAAAPQDMSLDAQASMADRVIEATSTSVHAVSEPSPPSATITVLEQKVAALAIAVEKLTKQAHYSRGRSSHRASSRPQSSSPARESTAGHSELCYYHRKFCNAAYSCRPPCSRRGNSVARH